MRMEYKAKIFRTKFFLPTFPRMPLFFYFNITKEEKKRNLKRYYGNYEIIRIRNSKRENFYRKYRILSTLRSLGNSTN